MKIFLKAMNKNVRGFQYLKFTFSRRISEAKLEDWVFASSQVRELMTDRAFNSKVNRAEERAWTALLEACRYLLGNTKPDTYQKIIEELIFAYKPLGRNMSLKIELNAICTHTFLYSNDQCSTNFTNG